MPYTWELDKGYKEMKNIVEPEPEKACEHFETRQAFLQLCQLNHYQFDQLRRAKHSSMMVLYHLHNPEAPVDAATCNSCHSSINQGVRWHCATCNFDICSECKEGGKVKHPHELTSMSVAMTEDEKAQDKKAREERQRSIQLHMQLLVHASGCRNQLVLSPPPPASMNLSCCTIADLCFPLALSLALLFSRLQCPSNNCAKMKALLKHGATCAQRASGGCHICRRIWALLQIHARQCNKPENTCPVPRCGDLREHLRRLQQRQAEVSAPSRAPPTPCYYTHGNLLCLDGGAPAARSDRAVQADAVRRRRARGDGGGGPREEKQEAGCEGSRGGGTGTGQQSCARQGRRGEEHSGKGLKVSREPNKRRRFVSCARVVIWSA